MQSKLCRTCPHYKQGRAGLHQNVIGRSMTALSPVPSPSNTNFLNKIITGDETWCFAYDPETKRQSSEWVGKTFPRPKKLKFQRYRIKTMLIIFSESQCVVHKEFLPEGKTVNAEFYKQVMDRLLKRLHRVRPAAFCSRDFFLLHDNAPAHTAANV
jgi:hypothetical protein